MTNMSSLKPPPDAKFFSPSPSSSQTSTPVPSSSTTTTTGSQQPISLNSTSTGTRTSDDDYDAASTTSSSNTSSFLTPQTIAALRGLALFSSLVSALCAGSITIFSLYAPQLQARLHYSQYRVNGLASAASLAMYAPVPLLGYLCDRVGPAPLGMLAGLGFGVGYTGAAVAFARERDGVEGRSPGRVLVPAEAWGDKVGAARVEGQWYAVMVASFVMIGIATCSMYMAAVATCAKNFGRGKHRGLAVALPIAAFGLSGMWLSQVGSRLFGDGSPQGDVDVFRFFLFLAVMLFIVGAVGSLGLRIIDEEELIEDAVEELERSGILESSVLLSPSRVESGTANGYGTIPPSDPDEPLINPTLIKDGALTLKKRFVLNTETARFLSDHTMWLFALGFFFMIGPGEAFINNMGTVLKSLSPPPTTVHLFDSSSTSPATHVSIIALSSTATRLLTGTLTDLLAPSPATQHPQLTPSPIQQRQRFTLSRVPFLLIFALLLSLGLSLLASGAMQSNPTHFWIVSSLVGAGYGAVFSLTPIIITVIWGVENFATNWGIVAMFPALGATLWGVVYSAVYQAGVRKSILGPGDVNDGGEENICYGQQCYAPAFWAMAGSVWVACGLVVWAWKGRNGWAQRGIVV